MDNWTQTAADPPVWIVVFSPYSDSRWVRFFAFGRFKHVGAIAYLATMRAWVTFDLGAIGTRITVLPAGDYANAVINKWVNGCTLVRIERDFSRRRCAPVFGWCVPQIASLIGLPGSPLRPDGLFRKCLANGGVILNAEHAATGPSERPDVAGAAAAGSTR